jgi:hypothetical protein
MQARYRAMLLARSPEERVRMADSMFSSARRLVVASILAADPLASPAAIRRGLFLRFYGHEFDEPTRERILDRLASPAAGRGVRRQVPVDWEGLEAALTWRSDEHEFFLDARTGEVRRCPLSAFGGDAEDDELTPDEADEGLAAGHLVRIEPIESSVEYDWMAEFAASVANARLRDRLEHALDGRHPFRRFKDVLAQHPAERERWFRVHDERLREAMRAWLEDHDIDPVARPPGLDLR